MHPRLIAGASLVAFVLGAWLPRPAAAQGVGAIGGTLTDASGALLPGVTVTLVSAGTIGGNQEVLTGERGTYQFTRLVPGRYGVKAALAGFRPAAQDDIVVTADVTSRADLRLEVGQLEEGIVVRGQAPLLDTTSALKQASVSAEVLTSLPNRVDVWGIVKMVPSVNLGKVDVGGNESFLQSTTTVHGTANENSFMVDGMDVSAPVGVGTQISIYPDPYLLQEINFQLGNGSAEVSQGGVVFNQITKTGTNRFHGGYMFAGANRGMGSANASPALRAQLLASVPQKVLAANPNIVPGADIQHIYDTGVWLSGPILRDRLWFLAAGHTQVLNQYILGSYDPDGSQVVDDNVMWNGAYKLSWQMTRSSQLSYFYNLQYKLIRYRNDDNAFVETRARNFNYKYPTVNQLKWTTPLGSRLVADVSGSVSITPVDAFRPQPEVKAGDIGRFDSVLNTITVARPVYNDPRYFRGVLLSSLSYYRSNHTVKFGYQLNRSTVTTNAFSLSDGIRAVYRNGVPDSVNTYNTPVNYEQSTIDQAIYVQDRWTPFKRLTLNLGLRFESFYGHQPAACQPQTTWVAERCFPAIEGAPDFKGPAPRLSAVYDVFGNGGTAVKVAVNRYHTPQGVSLIGRINPLVVTNDTRSWADANGDLLPQANELGPSTGFNFGTTNRFSPDLEWPVANDIGGAPAPVSRERDRDGGLHPPRDAAQHRIGQPGGAPGDLYPAAGDRSDQRAAGDRLQSGAVAAGPVRRAVRQLPGPGYQLQRPGPDRPAAPEQRVDALGRRQLRQSDGGHFLRGCLRQHLHQRGEQPQLPVPARAGGNDTPYTFRLSGIYVLPYQVWVSGTAQHNAGFPEVTSVLVGSNTAALTQVSQSLVVEPRGTTRLPALNSIDLSVKRPVKRGIVSVEPRLDIYNLTNAATILGRITQLGPTYGRVNSIQKGRLIKLGLNVDF